MSQAREIGAFYSFFSRTLCILFILFLNFSPTLADGPCVGDRYCTICTDCSRCAHCSLQGNSCGVCSAGGSEDGTPSHDDLYGHALNIFAADKKVDSTILEITSQLREAQITPAEAQNMIEQLEVLYRQEIFSLNRKENFQARTLFSQIVGERHETYILSTLDDPDGVLENPAVRSQMPTVTVSNLFYDLSAAQMQRLELLNEGLKTEIRSGTAAARPVYDQQLEAANKYREARSSIDRILANPD